MSVPAGERSLAVLRERACDPAHPFAAPERAILADLRAALLASDAITVTLGGRGGRLGETVVATGLLEGFLLALAALGKVGTPLRVAVDGPAIQLFDADHYRARYWPAISVAPLGDTAAEASITASQTFALDLHGAHDGPPALRVAVDGLRRAVTCGSLFRVGVREYAARGPLRRYADCLEDVLTLPPGSLDGRAAQPALRLPADGARFAKLAATLGLRPGVPLVVGCFQSAVVAKCYGHWRAVLDGISARLAAPGTMLDLLIACGPDEANPPGARYADLAEEFTGFTGSGGNLRTVVARTATLSDLACCLRHATLALTNDSAPGHIAGALGVPVVTPYLPGDVYSMRVWASTLAHHGVTSDVAYTRQQVESAVLWDHTDVIDSIPPERLVAPALAALAAAGLT